MGHEADRVIGRVSSILRLARQQLAGRRVWCPTCKRDVGDRFLMRRTADLGFHARCEKCEAICEIDPDIISMLASLEEGQ